MQWPEKKISLHLKHRLMKNITALVVFALLVIPFNAQIDVGGMVKNKVNQRVEQKTNQAIDKTLDKTEEGVKEAAKGDKKKKGRIIKRKNRRANQISGLLSNPKGLLKRSFHILQKTEFVQPQENINRWFGT